MAECGWLLGYSNQSCPSWPLHLQISFSLLTTHINHTHRDTQHKHLYNNIGDAVICYCMLQVTTSLVINEQRQISYLYFSFLLLSNPCPCCWWSCLCGSLLRLRVQLHLFLQHLLTAPSSVNFSPGRRRTTSVSTRLSFRCVVSRLRRREAAMQSMMERLELGSLHLPWRSPHSTAALSTMPTFPFGKRLVLSSDSVMASVSLAQLWRHHAKLFKSNQYQTSELFCYPFTFFELKQRVALLCSTWSKSVGRFSLNQSN